MPRRLESRQARTLAAARWFAAASRIPRPLSALDLFAATGGPPGFVRLATTRDGERIGGNIVGEDGAGGNVGTVADAQGRNERRVASDENTPADCGRMLGHSVVIAGDRSGADICVAPDGG